MNKLFSIIYILLPLSLFSQGTWDEKNAFYLPQQASDFPSDRTHPISFNIGNSIYYGSGFYEHAVSLPTYYNDFFAFDLTTNLWSKKNNLTFLSRSHSISFNWPPENSL